MKQIGLRLFPIPPRLLSPSEEQPHLFRKRYKGIKKIPPVLQVEPNLE